MRVEEYSMPVEREVLYFTEEGRHYVEIRSDALQDPVSVIEEDVRCNRLLHYPPEFRTAYEIAKSRDPQVVRKAINISTITQYSKELGKWVQIVDLDFVPVSIAEYLGIAKTLEV